MKHLIYFLVFFISNQIVGQCVLGDCNNGQGTLLLPNSSKYEGSFKSGNFHGKGRLLYANGDVYKGNFNKGVKSGIGQYTFRDGSVYVGEFKQDARWGKGKMTFIKGEEYKGNWVNGEMHGEGSYQFVDGNRYEGQFKLGKMDGKGIMLTSNGTSISGTWKDNKFINDKVKTQAPIANQVIKNCTNSYCHLEQGAYYYEDGSVFFGDFVEGKPNGNGKCEYINGDVYEGGWLNHAPHGDGIIFTANGHEIAGQFNNGKLIKRSYPSVKEEDRPNNTIANRHAPKEGSQIYAVIVGVASYNHLKSLKYTDDDAYHLYAFLKSPQGGALPDDQISLLIDEAATRDKISTAIQNVMQKADKDDVVLVYLSGHGLNGAYVPYDFDGVNNLLQYDQILASITASPAKNKLLITDACHSGSMYASKSGLDHKLKDFYQALANTQSGMAMMTSSKDSEVSLEYSGMRQGIFSHFLIRGLKGEANKNQDEIITLQELFDYISLNVKHYTNGGQTPLLRGTASPNMPVAMVYNN